MAISSSSEIIRDMENTLKITCRDIEKTQQAIKHAAQATENWNDAKGEQYRKLLKRIAIATVSPMEVLNISSQKLERLAVALDAYNNVRF